MKKKHEFYMDTNVFISSLKPDDPYYGETKRIIEGLKEGEMIAETSTLTLLETAAVSGRLFTMRRKSAEEPEESEKKLRKVFIIRVLKNLNVVGVKFVNMTGDTPVSVKGIQATIPSVMNDGILLSLECSLRTLDLIHLAAARYAKRVNADLDAFVTGDKDFLTNRKELFEILGMPILSPNEYLETFGIGKKKLSIKDSKSA